MSGMVEPTIFGRAEPSQSGSKLDLLEPSWAQKLKFDIARAELSPKAQIWYWSSRAISLNCPSHQPEPAKRINQTWTKSAHSGGCDTILATDSANLYYISHYFSIFLRLAQFGTNLIFLNEPSRAEPVAQTLEMIELSRAKGSKLRNDRAELSRSSSRLLARALLDPERLDPLDTKPFFFVCSYFCLFVFYSERVEPLRLEQSLSH